MVPLKVTKSITSSMSYVTESILLTVSELTIRDELWDPFEDVSKQYGFADVVEMP